MSADEYDPFEQGPFAIGAQTVNATDKVRNRLFPCEIWYPAVGGAMTGYLCREESRDAAPLAGRHPLIAFSHGSGLGRRSATYLCRHLAGHGYVVVAMDHSEVVAEELAGRTDETVGERTARVDAVIGSRVPDIRFLLDFLMEGGRTNIELDAARIGLAGYSFGGWTVLATTEVEPRVRSVVAIAPGGGSNPRPGILPVTLAFAGRRDALTLYLAAEDDVLIPLPGVIELFERTPGAKRLFVLQRADHQHFIDDVELAHETLRATNFPDDAAWIPASMRPIEELCSGEEAHTFVCGLTLAHFDASLRQMSEAERFLGSGTSAWFAARGVSAVEWGSAR